MGLNTLKLNYIFWSFVEQPWHKFNFTDDILPYINEREGKINDGCPENRQNRKTTDNCSANLRGNSLKI
jgi:hypothetical protein